MTLPLSLSFITTTHDPGNAGETGSLGQWCGQEGMGPSDHTTLSQLRPPSGKHFLLWSSLEGSLEASPDCLWHPL